MKTNGELKEAARRVVAICPECNHPQDAHRPMCLVFVDEGQACECEYADEVVAVEATQPCIDCGAEQTTMLFGLWWCDEHMPNVPG